MTEIWEEIWENLSSVFDWLKGQVAEVNPAAESTAECKKTEIYPFGAFLSFSREGKLDDEDLVVSVNCKKEGAALQLTCDILMGRGLVDGPDATIDDFLSDSDAHAESVREWLASVEDFLRSNKDLICQNLRRVES